MFDRAKYLLVVHMRNTGFTEMEIADCLREETALMLRKETPLMRRKNHD